MSVDFPKYEFPRMDSQFIIHSKIQAAHPHRMRRLHYLHTSMRAEQPKVYHALPRSMSMLVLRYLGVLHS